MNDLKSNDVEINDGANISAESFERIAYRGQLSRAISCLFSPFCSLMSPSEGKHDHESRDEISVAERCESPRLEWSKKTDFLLSIIGFAVDLANVSN